MEGLNLPTELLWRIVCQLREGHQCQTLAKLARTNRIIHDMVTPKLYESMVLTKNNQPLLRYGHFQHMRSHSDDILVATNKVDILRDNRCEACRHPLTNRTPNDDACMDHGRWKEGCEYCWKSRQRMSEREHCSRDLEEDSNSWITHKRPECSKEIYKSLDRSVSYPRQTRKDRAVRYCHRLLVDAPLTEGSVFDTPYTSAGEYLKNYAEVKEIVITSRAMSMTSFPYDYEYPDDYDNRGGCRGREVDRQPRWTSLLQRLATFNQGMISTPERRKRIVWHMPSHHTSFHDIFSETIKRDKRKYRGTGTSHYHDVSGLNMAIEVSAEDWRGLSAGIRSAPSTRATLVRWLYLVFRPVSKNHWTTHARYPGDHLPKLVLYDIYDLLLQPGEIPSDPQEALDKARNRLRQLLIDLTTLYDEMTRKCVDDIMSHIRLEVDSNKGKEPEQYPWWRPEPVSLLMRRDGEANETSCPSGALSNFSRLS
jgi:hypothetical protein